MTKAEAIEEILSIARGEIGYREKASNSQLDDKDANAGSGNYTKYARDLDAVTNFYNGWKNGYAWCDMFNDWCHYKAWGADLAMQVLCQPQKSAGAGCMYSAQYYKNIGRWHTSNPQPGDQIFFCSGGEIGHTGIVESVSATTVTTIEGNTSDMVARRTYNLNSSYIAGYGRPRYELVCGNDSGESDVEHPVTTAPEQTVPTPNKYNLQKGDNNSYVKELQEKLIELGYSLPRYGADGDFGDETLEAVNKFQDENGLVVDGIVGHATWAKIEELLNKKAQQATKTPTMSSPEKPILRFGSKGPSVKELQEKLIALGYSCGSDGADGKFGWNTYKAVLRFQRERGLEIDGVVGPKTWAELLK